MLDGAGLDSADKVDLAIRNEFNQAQPDIGKLSQLIENANFDPFIIKTNEEDDNKQITNAIYKNKQKLGNNYYDFYKSVVEIMLLKFESEKNPNCAFRILDDICCLHPEKYNYEDIANFLKKIIVLQNNEDFFKTIKGFSRDSKVFLSNSEISKHLNDYEKKWLTALVNNQQYPVPASDDDELLARLQRLRPGALQSRGLGTIAKVCELQITADNQEDWSLFEDSVITSTQLPNVPNNTPQDDLSPTQIPIASNTPYHSWGTPAFQTFQHNALLLNAVQKAFEKNYTVDDELDIKIKDDLFESSEPTKAWEKVNVSQNKLEYKKDAYTKQSDLFGDTPEKNREAKTLTAQVEGAPQNPKIVLKGEGGNVAKDIAKIAREVDFGQLPEGKRKVYTLNAVGKTNEQINKILIEFTRGGLDLNFLSINTDSGKIKSLDYVNTQGNLLNTILTELNYAEIRKNRHKK